MTPIDQDDLDFMLRNPQSRRFLWWLLSSCGIYATSFNESAALAALREGERNVGLRVLAEIGRVYPLAYAELMREQIDAALKAEAVAAAAAKEPTE